VLVPLALVLTASFSITTFYLEKVTTYFQEVKERSIDEYIESKKAKSEMWVEQLNLLFDYKNVRIDEEIKLKLQSRVDMAYESARYIYKKYKAKKSKREIKQRIVDALKQMTYGDRKDYIFITDYNANNILSRNALKGRKNLSAYTDADGRAIILEEIQKVRRRGGGFIQSKFYEGSDEQISLVKDLGIYNWYIGSAIDISQQRDALKQTLLEMIQAIPMDNSDFMGLYNSNEVLFVSKKDNDKFGDSLELIGKNLSKQTIWYEDKLESYYYYGKYYEALDWYLVYGFEISNMSAKELAKQKKLEYMLDGELAFIIKVSLSIVIFVVLLSLLLSRKINKIFSAYQEEVQSRTVELESLNNFLEQRVSEEVKAHIEKDKMLIQQSKMAEMGDMLSMIAHQWRQPLNQMSLLFMNVDSAYEFDELTKEYLDEKIKEGNELLEFMSVTIDDFRNYFRPDTGKEFVLVSDVVTKSMLLMKKSLDVAGIEVEINNIGRDLTHMYRNAFIQVILNLIKNAKDILIQKEIKNPKITIISRCQSEMLVVEVCDNGGGVDEKIIDKIFEPYYSTKDKKTGTGLGLYMSKVIIEEHLEGKLTVHNSDDGACFKIEL